MIKIPKYKGSSHFQHYKDAVERCKGVKKTALKAIEIGMEVMYDEYDKRFANSDVHNQPFHKLSATIQNYLRSLFVSGNTITEIFRNNYNDRVKQHNMLYAYKCPYCTLNEANTLEHILPKQSYPEYAVHAYNLIPCCSKCNSYKGADIKDESGIPWTLNFYYHDPDAFHYLEAEFKTDANGFPEFEYHLNFPDDCDQLLKRIIENHYEKLHLLDRFKEMAEGRYAEEEIRLLNCGSIAEVVENLSSYISSAGFRYGRNHYYVAMLRCMVFSNEYQSYLANKLAVS